MTKFMNKLLSKFSLQKYRLLIAERIGMIRLNILERNVQRLTAYILTQKYNSINAKKGFKLDINKHELKIYSQNGEDGILLHIFDKIGATNRCFVEFGIDDGKECNTANLSINFGWNGLLMDADEKKLVRAKKYYIHMIGNNQTKVNCVQCKVTMDNINQTLKANNIYGEIDLLSIDIDGNDYWIWKAINAINPRVVVIEYNASLGSEKSITVKYDPNFDRFNYSTPLYHGASLLALTKLANLKGYILVGCDSTGINAFFVRKDLVKNNLKEVSVKDAYFPHSLRLNNMSSSEQLDLISKLDFIEV